MTNEHNDHMEDGALHAYVDDELSAEQRAEVEALMARDPEAARKVVSVERSRAKAEIAFIRSLQAKAAR